jgi:teichuronic acid biosynthesis glycosyltransferase TuaC
MTMNALWVTSAYPSDQLPGSGVFHETQAQALIRLGVEVTVISPLPKSPAVLRLLKKKYRSGQEIPEVYERKGITVYRPNYLALPGQLRWAQPDKRLSKVILQTVNKYKLQPDLIHAHFAMPSGGATRRVADELKLPWLLTLHGSDVNIYPTYSSGARKAFIKTIEAANNVLAVGGSLSQKTKEMTGRESLVLPIGINLNQFQPSAESKDQIRQRLQLPEHKKIITFVGRLTEAKGIQELTKALDDLSEEVAVVFVGDGPAKVRLNQHPELNRRLYLTGQVENERVKDYLLASDVFALPSYTEGMPTVVIEAIALKVPVVCTAVGGLPDLFGNYRDLLIEPKSVSQLVKQIHEVLYGDRSSQKIINDLYSHIQANFRVDQNAKVLKDTYIRTVEEAF